MSNIVRYIYQTVRHIIAPLFLLGLITGTCLVELKLQREQQDEIERYHNAEIQLKVIELQGNVKCQGG